MFASYALQKDVAEFAHALLQSTADVRRACNSLILALRDGTSVQDVAADVCDTKGMLHVLALKQPLWALWSVTTGPPTSKPRRQPI